MKALFLPVVIVLFQMAGFSQINSKNEIPFDLLPSGHILVKAKVDGVEGSFIFDTGAGLTVFTKSFFQKLKDTVKQDGGYTGFRATGERLDIDLYTVSNFELGNMRKQKDEVSWLDVNLGGIDGIISLKSVEEYPFTFDFIKKVIRVESAATLTTIRKTAKVIPVQLEQSRDRSLTIFAYFKVNDKLTLQFSMDSGAGKDIYRINSKHLQTFGINTNDTANVKRIDKKSEFDTTFVSSIFITQVNTISPAAQPSISVAKPNVQFVDGLIYDGIIWMNWLGSQISFDLKNKQLLVR
ncbi:retroviral-like aspartic protease family protein [Terrimonas sp. NA20]|uniref:Retroviral-like aspartic protease family protein n=1 Tax=Terrimonas ginsenosidimutans TaxID=2908004 RepID=A0ABS9KUE8_9BACT|nr:retropepsin-like aspartic protease [Terrimonas ginsenosidimutans]MCG2615961.1 retroviral-like aspartic protease family protein [Terrimonas ginsenosidimutans]